MTKKVKISRDKTAIKIECFNIETMAEVYYILIEGIKRINENGKTFEPKTNYIT